MPSGDTMSAAVVGGVLVVVHGSAWPLLLPAWAMLGRQARCGSPLAKRRLPQRPFTAA